MDRVKIPMWGKYYKYLAPDPTRIAAWPVRFASVFHLSVAGFNFDIKTAL